MRKFRKTTRAKQWIDLDTGGHQIGFPLVDQQNMPAYSGSGVLCSIYHTGEIVDVPLTMLREYPESPIPEPTK
jgi:hypothetical protein